MTAELLRRAADRLDSSSAPIKTEAWDYDKFEDDTPWVVHLDIDWDDDDVPTIATTGLECTDRDRAGWIALLDPQIAAPLAALLRDSAFLLEHDDDPDRHQSQIALARAILGEDQ